MTWNVLGVKNSRFLYVSHIWRCLDKYFFPNALHGLKSLRTIAVEDKDSISYLMCYITAQFSNKFKVSAICLMSSSIQQDISFEK